MSEETTDDMGELGSPRPTPSAVPHTGMAIPLTPSEPEPITQLEGSLVSALGPPHVEELVDGTRLTFPLITMDDWSATVRALQDKRRQIAKLRLSQNPQPSPQDREWLLLRLDQELLTFMQAFGYRTKTPDGIKAGLVRQLMKGNGIDFKAATALVDRIIPARQETIISIIADPPLPQKPKPGEPPNAESASTNETGKSMPGSSDESSESTLEPLP